MPGIIAEPPPTKARKPTKNELRRAKKKQEKEGKREVCCICYGWMMCYHVEQNLQVSVTPKLETTAAESDTTPSLPENAHPVPQPPQVAQTAKNNALGDDSSVTIVDDLHSDDPLVSQFANVFARFNYEDREESAVVEPEKAPVFYDDDENFQSEDEEEETQKKISKKARKVANKLSIAELKAIVRKPEIVEWTDTSAQDPKLLVNIKSTRNVVPVPAHWSLKREYLSSKRGIEKPAYALPKFIAETGISEMRDAVLEKQADATLKQRQRERVQPKMGKLDIDYQKLYEAFFRRQTKPTLTRYGEVYYEGKEFETNLRHLRPGELNDELKEALNMPPGAPPPWLINMQKIGPPPSYPALKIPGLNAPPPPGASWGFHPGGYGKPPMDVNNRPLWGGDVFGQDLVKQQEEKPRAIEVDRTLWGELQPYKEEEDEDEDEEEEDEEEDNKELESSGLKTPFAGTETPGGITSTVPTDFGLGLQSVEEFTLRKQKRGTETEESNHPRKAGQVLQERSIRAEGFFGGEKAYNLNPNAPVLGQEQRGSKRKAGDIDVSVDIDALGEGRLSKDETKKLYDSQRQQQGGGGGWKGSTVDQEDLSQMIAEESAKRQKRYQQRQQERRGGRR